MPRPRLIPLVLLSAALAVPTAAHARSAPAFSLGTFSGAISGGGTAKIRLSKGTCDRVRQNVTQVKGYCITIKALPARVATCSDGRSQDPILSEYLQSHAVIHISPSGRYRDTAVEGVGDGDKHLVSTVLKIDAKGRRITGSVRTSGSPYGDVQCDSGTQTFTLKR